MHSCERCGSVEGICAVGAGPWLCADCFWIHLQRRADKIVEDCKHAEEIAALKAEVEGWKKGVIDANRISQRFQADAIDARNEATIAKKELLDALEENDRLRLEIERYRAMLAEI